MESSHQSAQTTFNRHHQSPTHVCFGAILVDNSRSPYILQPFLAEGSVYTIQSRPYKSCSGGIYVCNVVAHTRFKHHPIIQHCVGPLIIRVFTYVCRPSISSSSHGCKSKASKFPVVSASFTHRFISLLKSPNCNHHMQPTSHTQLRQGCSMPHEHAFCLKDSCALPFSIETS